MPLSIQIPARGDQYLYQGIAGAGHAIADGIETMQKNLKQAKAYRAMAVDGLGMDPDQVDKMSLGELQGHLQAVSVKNAIEQTKAQAEDRQAQAQQRLARAAQIAEAQRQSMEMQGFAQDYADGGAGSNQSSVTSDQSEVDPGGEAMPGAAAGAAPAALSHQQRLLYALGRHPAAFGTPQFDNSVGSLQKLATTGAGMSPQAWQSPQGNPYVFLDHTLMPDKAPADMSGLATQVPEGYEMVQTGPNKSQLVKTQKALPAAFNTTLDKISEDIAKAQATIDGGVAAGVDPKVAQSNIESAKRRLATAMQRGKATVDRYHSTGFLTDPQRDSMYQSLGIGAGNGTGATGTVALPGGRVTVADKSGKKFTLPAGQLGAALKQGYTEVK